MRLVYELTGRECKPGDVTIIKGEAWIVTLTPKPHKPASSGHVHLTSPCGAHTATYYVGVIGAEWIEREDRDEHH